MNILKDVLKNRRKEANLTQQEIAQKLNVTQSCYSHMENGRMEPSLKVFSKLAAILDIDVNYPDLTLRV